MIQLGFQVLRQHLCIGKAASLNSLAQASQRLFAKLAHNPKVQQVTQLGVIAQLRVCIQRKVIGKKVNVVRQQQGQSLLHPPRDPPVLATPKKTMMNEYCVCMRRDRRLNQRTTGGHTRHDFADFLNPLDLQAIGTEVLETLWLEQCVKRL